MSKQLFDKEKPKKQTEAKEETNSDFQKLMDKDVVLDKDIQDVLVKDSGRCDRLNENQRANYVAFLCEKVGIDPTFRPIDLIPTKNGIRPYLNKGASELIRDKRKISIDDMQIKEVDKMWIATCRVRSFDGRTDTDIGVCQKNGTEKSPMNPNDSLMKAVTKAKRRATLSMCGLGAIIEEAHPTEYNGAIEQECKSQILLEDGTSAKKFFSGIVVTKIGVNEKELAKEVLLDLCDQAKRLAQTDKIEKAAEWLRDNGIISLVVNEETGVVTKATIREKQDASN